jgi:catechol 2,3-dioxygenase-like lactoylglutathione lyase family enzyme
MAPELTYVIEFVGDMTRTVAFYRDFVGLPLKFESPDSSEFSTGETSLALHLASDKNPAGKLEIGFGVPAAITLLGAREHTGGERAPRAEVCDGHRSSGAYGFGTVG